LPSTPDPISSDDLRAAFRRDAALPVSDLLPEPRFGTALLDDERLRPLLPPTITPAAVLVPVVERRPGLTVLLTERAADLKHHPGQVSFPGGRQEAHDPDPIATALRETEEEIGLTARHVEVVGRLEDYIVVTGYRITPVVGLVRPGFDLALDLREVAGTFEVPLDFILDVRNVRWTTRYYAEVPLQVAEINFEGHRVWGATAAMLVALARHLERSRR
jgi:8-oxo-dGTP pyrophosphatase MutT (NUDIX family)